MGQSEKRVDLCALVSIKTGYRREAHLLLRVAVVDDKEESLGAHTTDDGKSSSHTVIPGVHSRLFELFGQS